MRKINEFLCEKAVCAVLRIAEVLAAAGLIHGKAKKRQKQPNTLR